jgi:hypothetical protein
MPTGQPQTLERRGVRAQLVGDQQFWRKALLLEKLAHQRFGAPADPAPGTIARKPIILEDLHLFGGEAAQLDRRPRQWWVRQYAGLIRGFLSTGVWFCPGVGLGEGRQIPVPNSDVKMTPCPKEQKLKS